MTVLRPGPAAGRYDSVVARDSEQGKARFEARRRTQILSHWHWLGLVLAGTAQQGVGGTWPGDVSEFSTENGEA